MRIVLVAHAFGFRDGQGRVNYEVVRAAHEAGIAVTIIAENCEDDLSAMAGLRVIKIAESSLPTRLLKNVSFAIRSARWLKRRRDEFDIIQVNGYVTLAHADVAAAHFVHSAWAKHPNYPFRFSLTKPSDLYQRLFTWFNAWQEKAVYRRAKCVIAVSRKTAREVQALGVEKSKIYVLYNGVDVEAYYPGDAERSRFNLPEGVSLGLFVGDLKTPRKNLGVILQAMQDLPDLRLAVAGDTAGSIYPRMARDLEIEDRVFFLGKIAEIPRLMRSVDLFIFPSRYEAHPLVVMEALASGLPVIVSSHVAAGEAFSEATIVLADAEDASALSDCIADLLRAPHRMEALGKAARQYALQMSWSATAAKYLEVYAHLVQGKALLAESA